jgi:hypothetical protein
MRLSNRPRPGSGLPFRKTLGDYIGIAISPALIMTLVGSLVYFLLEISYSGEYQATVRWALFWFVLAMVLISRISIEQNADLAMMYGFMLAMATALMLSQYIGSHLVVWCILGLIWWCANKLTWDCTLINDEEDASGQGLLDVAATGERKSAETTPATESVTPPPKPPSPPPVLSPVSTPVSMGQGRKPVPVPPPLPLPPPMPNPVTGSTGSATTPSKRSSGNPIANWFFQRRQKKRRAKLTTQPHAPGLWVVYFSLAALPVFGFGQGLVATDDAHQRYAFLLLLVYVTSGLGLLLITSFLGLRRYLRQRRLRMPLAIAATWITMGSALAVGILGLALLLPRPAIEGSSAPKFLDQFTKPKSASNDQTSNTRLAGKGARPGRQPGKDVQKGSAPSDNQANADQGNTERQEQAGTTTASQPEPPPPSLDWLRWVVLGFLIVLLLRWLGRHWRQIKEAFMNWWRSSRRRRQPSPVVASTPALMPRPFSAFSNPFGGAGEPRTPPSELLVYTFNAMAAWASEKHCPHLPDQTPMEFGRQMARLFPGLNPEIVQVAQLYSRLAYAAESIPRDSLEVMRNLWTKIENRNLAGVATR